MHLQFKVARWLIFPVGPILDFLARFAAKSGVYEATDQCHLSHTQRWSGWGQNVGHRLAILPPLFLNGSLDRNLVDFESERSSPAIF